jgi:hypothetical protein
LSIASFAGVDLANATVERAKSLADLLDGRSPGERMKGELTKTKHKTVALAERDVPKPNAAKELVEALMPPPADALVPVTIDVPPVAELTPPTPPGVIFTPPPGTIVPPCCSVVPPPGPPGSPPPPPPGPPTPPPGPPPPPPPPAVPEPGTWMTMVVGFGLSGWFIRRRRPMQVKRSNA